MTNPYGDVELDAAGMRALAHPVRVRILFELRSAPATATMLSDKVGASPSVTSWHLRHLAEHGLVEDAPELGRGLASATGGRSAPASGTPSPTSRASRPPRHCSRRWTR